MRRVLVAVWIASGLSACNADSDESDAAPDSPEPSAAPSFFRVLVRGAAKTGSDPSAAQAVHDDLAAASREKALAASQLSHSVFVNAKDPSDILIVDTFASVEDSRVLHPSDGPDVWAALFAKAPSVDVWQHPIGWREWGAIVPFKDDAPLFLFRIRNTLSADATEASRRTHNEVAGGESQSKAVALGDRAHNVHLSIGDPHELLFLDVWSDPAKAQQFFSDEDTQKGASQLFIGPPDVVVFVSTDWYEW
jgi:hypothetical protein